MNDISPKDFAALTSEKNEKQPKGLFREYAEAIFIALLVALTIRYFVIEAFRIPSASMVPTLLVGDHIFVNKFIYGVRIPFTNKKILQFRAPNRGDIIVFIYPHDHSKDYIKRVVGLPGDEIQVIKNQLIINGKEVPQEYEKDFLYSDISQGCEQRPFEMDRETIGNVSFNKLVDLRRFSEAYGPQKVEEGKLFVMGDNRDNSSDSRAWGQVPMENVKGKALFIWLSINRCGFQAPGAAGTFLDLVTLHWLRIGRMMSALH